MSEDNGILTQQQQLQPPKKEICRNYLWGVCDKYTQCRYRHELVYEEMLVNLKFCHDFQNKKYCTRPNCNYLHASKDEEVLFKTTKKLPRVLAERHAMLAAVSSRSDTVVMAPPPPPPSLDPRPGAQPAASYSVRSILQPPPPPPPPPPAPQQSSVQVTPANNYQTQNVYTGGNNQPHQAVTYPTQNNPLPIDTSRPPPTLVGRESAALKRNNPIDMTFGPAKMARSSTLCESCVEWEKRLEDSKHLIDDALREEADLELIYKQMVEEYEVCKSKFLSQLPKSRMQQKLEDLLEIEKPPQPQPSQWQPRNTSPSRAITNSPMGMLMELIKHVFDDDDVSRLDTQALSYTVREEPVKLKQTLGQLPPWSNNEVQMVPNFEPSVPPPTWVPTFQGYQTTQASRAPLFPSTSYQVRSPNSQNTSQSYSSYFAKYK